MKIKSHTLIESYSKQLNEGLVIHIFKFDVTHVKSYYNDKAKMNLLNIKSQALIESYSKQLHQALDKENIKLKLTHVIY